MVCQASETANEIFVLFCIQFFFCCHIEIHFAIRARNKKNENLHAASGGKKRIANDSMSRLNLWHIGLGTECRTTVVDTCWLSTPPFEPLSRWQTLLQIFICCAFEKPKPRTTQCCIFAGKCMWYLQLSWRVCTQWIIAVASKEKKRVCLLETAARTFDWKSKWPWLISEKKLQVLNCKALVECIDRDNECICQLIYVRVSPSDAFMENPEKKLPHGKCWIIYWRQIARVSRRVSLTTPAATRKRFGRVQQLHSMPLSYQTQIVPSPFIVIEQFEFY